MKTINEKLDEYLSLEKGWDGPLSLSPTPNMVYRIKEFIKLFPDNYTIPEPMVDCNGVIGLFYDDYEKWYLDMEFSALNNISLFIKNKITGDIIFKDKINYIDLTTDWIIVNLVLLNKNNYEL